MSEGNPWNRTKKLSPLDIFKLLPRINCRECGEENCLAFAAKLASREATPDNCPPLQTKGEKKIYAQLNEMLKPAVSEVVIGQGEKSVKIGGKLAMYRHEFPYSNPTAIAIDVTDEMPDEELLERVKKATRFCFEYIGQNLRIEMIAVRSTSNNPVKFRTAVGRVAENTDLPMILCSLEPKVMEAGLATVPEARPLVYAATKHNWRKMAALARTYKCALAVFAPGNLRLLKSLSKTLLDHGARDLVLDPGTFWSAGLADTLDAFTMTRKSACERKDRLLGFPLLGLPMTAWVEKGKAIDEIAAWREACLAALLIVRFADIMILHSIEGWSILPSVILRQNIYADPRKPMTVKACLKEFGTPDQDSPVMFTTNFALTFYTVANDIEAGKISTFLLVVDTGGIAVDSAVAGRKLTAAKVAEAIKASGIEDRVRHRRLIIPGKASRLSEEIEELSNWHVMVGPSDSSGIPKFLQEKW